jgi:hypothetical protein
MTARSLIQFAAADGRGVAVIDDDGTARRLAGVATTLDLAHRAIARGCTLADLAGELSRAVIDPATVRLLLPIDHADPAQVLVAGTGLTHLGSAEGRDAMHKAAAAGAATDSMRMFLSGLAGGKPAPGAIGAQPEWFYKGDGTILRATGETLDMPAFALDGGEEPEIAGVYLIGPDATVHRLGWCLGNEFSDHVTERQNYLWLAHSKLRQAALGPELLLGDLPASVAGISRIRRDGAVIWEKPFRSGEDHMSHALANLEHHHFKYAPFRRPGTVHVHFLGTATLSCADGIATRPGDVFEMAADPFRLPLANPLARADDAGLIAVRAL